MNCKSLTAGRCSVGIAAAAFALAAHAAPATAQVSSAEQRYQQERSHCLEGRSHQDRETCLKEAVNARAEARKQPETGTQQDWQRNALARCELVQAKDKDACVALVKGKGQQSGSVEGGGVIKEIVTKTGDPTLKIAPPSPK